MRPSSEPEGWGFWSSPFAHSFRPASGTTASEIRIFWLLLQPLLFLFKQAINFIGEFNQLFWVLLDRSLFTEVSP
jgi:hypothetical protein